MQAVERMLQHPDYREELRECNLRLAVVGTEIVGSAGWCQQTQGTARVRKVFVAPPLAGMGLGRRLMEVIEGTIHSAEIRNVVIRATINAVPFYERLGFHQVRRDMMISPDGVYVPMIIMNKRLP